MHASCLFLPSFSFLSKLKLDTLHMFCPEGEAPFSQASSPALLGHFHLLREIKDLFACVPLCLSLLSVHTASEIP